jgi:predicted acyl esterase
MRTTATTPEGLANGQADVAMPSGSLTDASGTGDPNSQQSDPILGYAGGAGPCRTSTAPSTGYTAVSQPLPRPLTYDDLATLTLHGFSWTGTTATVVLRLWDVTPGGATLLVDRGAYRLLAPQDTGKTELVIPFDGDHWVFPAGHQVRVDVVQTDTPAYLPSKQASATEWTSATLSLPTREAGTLALVSA